MDKTGTQHTELFLGVRYTSSPFSTAQKSESRERVKSATMDSTVRMTSSPVANDISKSSCARLARLFRVTIIQTDRPCLCELGLPIRPQVFVPETAGKLIVPPDAAGHEHLLILLGALRQSVCQAWASCGDQEFPRSLGGRFKQDWGLDFGEGEMVERLPQLEGYLGSNKEAGAEGVGKADLQVARRGGELDVFGNDDILGEDVERLDAFQVEVDSEDMGGKTPRCRNCTERLCLAIPIDVAGSRKGLCGLGIAVQVGNSACHGDRAVQRDASEGLVCGVLWGVGLLEAGGDLDGRPIVDLYVCKHELCVLYSFPGEEAVDGDGLSVLELGGCGSLWEVILAESAVVGWMRRAEVDDSYCIWPIPPAVAALQPSAARWLRLR